MKRAKEFPLVNTGATQAYDNKELNKIFETKNLSFLESHPVDVIGRKFNWIPARRGDPPRSETDMPPLKAEYNCTNVGVKSDFPKSISNWENAQMWKDGTYDDAKNSIYRAEDLSAKKVQFAPDYDFELRYNRMAQEQDVASNIADYFQNRETERTIENRIFLEEYGLTGAEVDEVMARIRVDGALQALKDPKRKVASNKKNFERIMAEAVTQKVEAQQRYADMDKRRVPIEEFIMEQSGGIPRGKGALRRAVSETPRGRAPLRDDIEEEIDAEPSAFDRRPAMGGAGGPDEGPDMEPRNYRFLKIKKKPTTEASETDPVNLRKRPEVADAKKLALFRYDAIAKSEKTYEAIDTIATRIDIENILRHKFGKTVTPNTSKPKLINLLLAELK